MRLVRASLAAVLLITMPCMLRADDAAPSEAAPASASEAEPAAEEGLTAEQFEASLSYERGVISIKDGLASLTLPEGYRFLGARDSKRLLEDAWGNPPGAADGVLGMIVPSGVSPLAEEGWAVVITHDEDGYVEDKDAAEIARLRNGG